jgi:hypothetical protein
MKFFLRKLTVGAVSLMAAALCTQALAQEADSLVKVKAKRIDQAYLLPGADFSGYKKVWIAPSEVAFQKDWLRNMNRQAVSLSQRLADKDARKIIDTARSGFDDIWAEAFKKAGYEVASASGDGVLKIIPSVVDLYVNAPELRNTVASRTYTVEAGEATLFLEVRDSVTGTLLGRAIDKRTARTSTGRMEMTNSVTNRADFAQLFRIWAKTAADGLVDLAQASPLPETLKPNQKLPTP